MQKQTPYNWDKLLSGLTPVPKVYHPHPMLSLHSPQNTQKKTLQHKQTPKLKDFEKIFTPSTTPSTTQRSYFPLFFSSTDAKFHQHYPQKVVSSQKQVVSSQKKVTRKLNPLATSFTPSSIKTTQKHQNHSK